MRYNKIRKMDIADGPGVRVSIFFQGCSFHCKNCFNPETHDFNGGQEFTDQTIQQVVQLGKPDYIKGLSLLGGEPMHPTNIDGAGRLAKAFKEAYPDKTVWAWTGFLFEQIKNKETLKYIDVLVDGQFEEDKKDYRLKFRGSANQRIIDVQRSLKEGKTVIIPDETL